MKNQLKTRLKTQGLTLSKLKVKSFVTENPLDQMATIKGGGDTETSYVPLTRAVCNIQKPTIHVINCRR